MPVHTIKYQRVGATMGDVMRYQVQTTIGDCTGGNCPTVYSDTQEETSVLVQGYVVSAEEAAELGVPAGEALVRVPRRLLEEATSG